MKSIIQDKKECLFCHSTSNLHKHHIFFGSANRKLSEKYGCWCWLCVRHHTSDDGVHFNRPLDLMLKEYCQQEFEKLHSHEEFMKIFGKNYIQTGNHFYWKGSFEDNDSGY